MINAKIDFKQNCVLITLIIQLTACVSSNPKGLGIENLYLIAHTIIIEDGDHHTSVISTTAMLQRLVFLLISDNQFNYSYWIYSDEIN